MADSDLEVPAGPAGHWLGLIDRAHDMLAGRIDSRKKQHLEDVLHQLEDDLRPVVGPVIERILANPELSDELRCLLSEAADPAHQFGSLVVGFAIGATVGPVLGAALEPEIEGIRQGVWHQNPTRRISADVAAAAVLKGVLSPGSGASAAQYQGYDSSDFGIMVEASGQSIGIAEALLLYRRGQINLGHLQDIVRYSNVNPKFYDDVPKLQYGPPPAGEVVAGLLKGHLSQGEAATRLGHAGIDPENLEWMRATAGRPPSPMEMVRLWHRGEATEADVEAAVRQSDINDDFLEFVKLAGRWYPPPRSIMAMLRDGSIDDSRGRELFRFAGVPDDIADDMIGEAHHSKGAAVKQLTTAQLVGMYSHRLISRPEANTKLTALRYTPADIALLLDYADDVRNERLLNATITKVGTKYVAHRINLTDAQHLLTTAGVSTAAQHDLFALWDIQRTANVVVPSASAVVGAYRRQDISALECRNRLTALGVQADDIDIFVADGWPPTKPADARAAVQRVQTATAANPNGTTTVQNPPAGTVTTP